MENSEQNNQDRECHRDKGLMYSEQLYRSEGSELELQSGTDNVYNNNSSIFRTCDHLTAYVKPHEPQQSVMNTPTKTFSHARSRFSAEIVHSDLCMLCGRMRQDVAGSCTGIIIIFFIFERIERTSNTKDQMGK